MTKVTNSTRVKAPNIQALDFRSHTTVDGRINDVTSLNPSGRDRKTQTTEFQEIPYYISNECTDYYLKKQTRTTHKTFQ